MTAAEASAADLFAAIVDALKLLDQEGLSTRAARARAILRHAIGRDTEAAS